MYRRPLKGFTLGLLALVALGASMSAFAIRLPTNSLRPNGSTLGEVSPGTWLGSVEPASFPAIWSASQLGAYSYSSRTGLYTFTISGAASGILDLNNSSAASSYFKIGNETVDISFSFNKSGQIVGPGKVSVYGTLAAGSYNGFSWQAINTPTLLWQASLAGGPGCTSSATACKPEVDLNHKALGFYEYGFSGWFATQKLPDGSNPFTQGSNSESLWLYTTCSVNVSACGRAAVSSQPSDGNESAYLSNRLTNLTWNLLLNAFNSASSRNPMGTLRNPLANAGVIYGVSSIAVVPVPAALGLLFGGLGMLGAASRRRRFAQTSA
jgi:hypothetical protein